ncbi:MULTISPECIES: hypothetical protein [Mycobacteriaceae]|uniref:Uncharacterized protein n=1 Tax=Mycobacteroides franklinii TaxID=948102 RepID=A0A4R5PDW2_9MYCO|nr:MULTISPECIES: hypothetical protein [Mycobacteriaceae]TDH23607.1 hypothetical protein EJ571_04860 [Mycobacteroides franklinii]
MNYNTIICYRRLTAAVAAPLAAFTLALSAPALAQAAGPGRAADSISTQAPAGPGCRHHNCWPRPGHGGGWGGGWSHGGGWGPHR